MICLNVISDISFIAIICLAGLLLLICMIKVVQIANFLIDVVVKIHNSLTWIFILTYFLAAIFFWIFSYNLVAYIILGVLLCLIVLQLLLVIDSFDIALDLVYSDFFGLFVFLYIGTCISLGIYFYTIDLIAPAFILPSAAIFYFGIMEVVILKGNYYSKKESKKEEVVYDKYHWQKYDSDLISFLEILSTDHSMYLLSVIAAMDRFIEFKIFNQHTQWIPEDYKEKPMNNYPEVMNAIIDKLDEKGENRKKVYRILLKYKLQFEREQKEMQELDKELKLVTDLLPDDFNLKLSPEIKKVKKEITKKKKGVGSAETEDKPKQIH